MSSSFAVETWQIPLCLAYLGAHLVADLHGLLGLAGMVIVG